MWENREKLYKLQMVRRQSLKIIFICSKRKFNFLASRSSVLKLFRCYSSVLKNVIVCVSLLGWFLAIGHFIAGNTLIQLVCMPSITLKSISHMVNFSFCVLSLTVLDTLGWTFFGKSKHVVFQNFWFDCLSIGPVAHLASSCSIKSFTVLSHRGNDASNVFDVQRMSCSLQSYTRVL